MIQGLEPDPPIRCRDFTIGVIGSGFIVNDIHLAAYRDAGFRVKGVASRTVDNARAAVEKWGLAHTYDSIDALLDDPEIEIVDIAIPPHVQPDVIRQAVERPHIRGLLVQKPLALDLATAAEMVALCEQRGKTLSINQNMRFDQSMRVARQLIDRGDLGEIVCAGIEMRAAPHWQPYIAAYNRLTLLNMSVHHLDIMRYLLGEVEGIFVHARTDPAVAFDHTDGICLSTLSFTSGAVATVIDDTYAFPRGETFPSDAGINWRIEGRDGVAKGTIGWPDYPDGSPSTCTFASPATGGEWATLQWSTMWFPHAFAGVMEQLQYAVSKGEAPALSGADNLKTMALIEAGYRSIAEKRMVNPAEITG